MRTYEELLAAQTELAHFNKYHDPNTGQFASGNGVSSKKAAKEENKLSKQEAKLIMYRESAKEAYNRSANAISYLNSGSKRERKDAGDWAARYYELGETYKQKAEKQLEKINKNGTRILMSSLDPYSKAVGDAFIKRSLAGQIGWMFNPFESLTSSSKYKINKEKANKMANEMASEMMKDFEERRKNINGE